MKRQDVYTLGLGGLQIFILFHTISILQAGAGISLMGENDFFGYITIALVVGLVSLSFSNLARLVSSIAKDELGAVNDIMYVGRMTLLLLLASVSLSLINAYALFAQYNYSA